MIELVGKADKFTKSLDDAGKASEQWSDKVSNAGKKMTAFVSVPIVGFLAAGTKAAMEDAAAQEHLALTLQNNVGNSKALVKQVEDYIGKAMKASTFTDDELRPAFETLATTTHSVEESQKLLTIAMDVAAGKNIDLETATKAVAKAHEGQFAAANKLVPGLVDVADKTTTVDQVMGRLSQTFNGQAQAATETTAGKMQNLKRDLGEAAESMGAKLLPAVTQFATFATDTLIPALDRLSGGNGAFVLLGLAAAGPVLSQVKNLQVALAAVNLELAPLIAGIAAITGGISVVNRIKDDDQGWKGKLNQILGGGGNKGIFGKDFLGLKYANGGVVPGPVGQAQMAVVHGGERITPYRGGDNGSWGGGTTVNVMVQGSVIAERDLGRVIADQLRNNALLGVG